MILILVLSNPNPARLTHAAMLTFFGKCFTASRAGPLKIVSGSFSLLKSIPCLVIYLTSSSPLGGFVVSMVISSIPATDADLRPSMPQIAPEGKNILHPFFFADSCNDCQSVSSNAWHRPKHPSHRAHSTRRNRGRTSTGSRRIVRQHCG